MVRLFFYFKCYLSSDVFRLAAVIQQFRFGCIFLRCVMSRFRHMNEKKYHILNENSFFLFIEINWPALISQYLLSE